MDNNQKPADRSSPLNDLGSATRQHHPKSNVLAIAVVAVCIALAPFAVAVSNAWLKWLPTSLPLAATAASAAAVTNSWRSSSVVDPMTDKVALIARIDATNGTTPLGGPIQLVAQCQDRFLTLEIKFGEYLGQDSGLQGTDLKSVTMRFGNQEPETMRLGISDNQTSIFEWGKAPQLFEKMLPHNRLIVQTQPYNELPVTATFDTTGIKEAFAPLLAKCPLPDKYGSPINVFLSFNGDNGHITEQNGGRQFSFSRSTPGSEYLYGDCRTTRQGACVVGMDVRDGKIARITSAFPDQAYVP